MVEINVEFLLKEILRLQASLAALVEILQRDHGVTLGPDFVPMFQKYQLQLAPRLGLQVVPETPEDVLRRLFPGDTQGAG